MRGAWLGIVCCAVVALVACGTPRPTPLPTPAPGARETRIAEDTSVALARTATADAVAATQTAAARPTNTPTPTETPVPTPTRPATPTAVPTRPPTPAVATAPAPAAPVLKPRQVLADDDLARGDGSWFGNNAPCDGSAQLSCHDARGLRIQVATPGQWVHVPNLLLPRLADVA
ncbi:MAG TPA: hypothetical protein VFW96_19385, partial [Thermomicrobiales bacterium]|nr:hypothetical protein [Thermomicrobiales bacterium]